MTVALRLWSWRLGLWLAALGTEACQGEYYFGPYSLSIPTDLQERSAMHTFRLPLGAGSLSAQEDLARCEQEEPEHPIPCLCDHPILKANQQDVRVDYRLSQSSGSAQNVEIWLGTLAPTGQPDPEDIPDLPQVQILADHLHRVSLDEPASDAFLEDELTAVDLAWSNLHAPDCPRIYDQLPAPTELLIGASLLAEASARVSLEFTVRVVER